MRQFSHSKFLFTSEFTLKANRWIKKMGQPSQIVVAKFTDGDYLKRLEG